MARGTLPGKPVENVIADTAAVACSDLLGHSVDLGRARDGFLFVTVDLHTELLNLELFGPLEALLVLHEPVNRPFPPAAIVDLGLEGALDVLLIEQGRLGPLLEGLDRLLVRH